MLKADTPMVFTETSPREFIERIAEAYLKPHKLHPEYERMKKTIADIMLTKYGFPVTDTD